MRLEPFSCLHRDNFFICNFSSLCSVLDCFSTVSVLFPTAVFYHLSMSFRHYLNDLHACSPNLCDTWQSLFALISSSAIVFLFLLISNDKCYFLACDFCIVSAYCLNHMKQQISLSLSQAIIDLKTHNMSQLLLSRLSW